MPMTAKGLAKLLEECGQLSQIAAKKLAYFHTDMHPDGAGSLKARLQDEMGDVIAACKLVLHTLELDAAAIEQRAHKKYALFTAWHAAPDNDSEAFDSPPGDDAATRQATR